MILSMLQMGWVTMRLQKYQQVAPRQISGETQNTITLSQKSMRGAARRFSIDALLSNHIYGIIYGHECAQQQRNHAQRKTSAVQSVLPITLRRYSGPPEAQSRIQLFLTNITRDAPTMFDARFITSP
jgi:hypothetical protein